LDKGFNNNALRRDVVMHGAWYVTPSFASAHGRVGRSWGCFAVNAGLVKPIINTVKDGSLLFAYYPDKQWLDSSKYLEA